METIESNKDDLILNHRCALERCDNDLELYVEICDMFYGAAMNVYSMLQGELDNLCRKELLQMLHGIAGVSRNVGAEKLLNFSSKLESEMYVSEEFDTLEVSQLEKLKSLIKEAVAKVEEIIPEKELPQA